MRAADRREYDCRSLSDAGPAAGGAEPDFNGVHGAQAYGHRVLKLISRTSAATVLEASV
jgi:hypothetical protein